MFTKDARQSGIVSILVTMVMMLVVTIIVLAFSQIIRREERQSFDRQLNTQAYYAAESGVNAAAEALQTDPQGIDAGYRDDFCDTPATPPVTNNLSLVLDAASNVRVSCIKIDDTVPELIYDSVGGNAVTVPVKTLVPLNSLTFAWQNAAGTSGCATSPIQLPPAGAWGCQVGILRLDLVPSAAVSRVGLQSSLFTAFLYPGGGGSTFGYGSANAQTTRGTIVPTACGGAPTTCTMTINGLSGQNYFARVSTIYGTSRLTITANGGGTEMFGTQAIVDVTGIAQDVLRRIQVRVPLSAGIFDAPSSAVHSADGICKRMLVSDRESPPFARNDIAGISNPGGVCDFDGS